MPGRAASAWSGGRRLVQTAALLAVLVSGCTAGSGPAAMSCMVRTSLPPYVGAFADFDQVADWRHLDRPTTKL